MIKIETGYKVCRKDLTEVGISKYISVCRPDGRTDKTHPFRVTYLIDEWVEPNVKDSRLFFFKKLDDASSFSGQEWDRDIFECEAIDVKKVKMLGNLSFLEEFWAYRKSKKKIPSRYRYDHNIPEGTYSASRIKLIRQITDTRSPSPQGLFL